MSSDIPDSFKYTSEHEWLEIDNDTVRVGITAFAQESLGDLVYVELPKVGQSFNAGDHFAVVESVKAASEVYAPITGEVLEVNQALADSPETINQSPYYDGWLVKLKISDSSELNDLMDAEAYTQFVEKLS